MKLQLGCCWVKLKITDHVQDHSHYEFVKENYGYNCDIHEKDSNTIRRRMRFDGMLDEMRFLSKHEEENGCDYP